MRMLEKGDSNQQSNQQNNSFHIQYMHTPVSAGDRFLELPWIPETMEKTEPRLSIGFSPPPTPEAFLSKDFPLAEWSGHDRL